MPYNCCSGNFSSRSFGGYLPYSGSSCGSSYNRNLIYSQNLFSPSTCQLGSSHYRGCQETFHRPTRCQTSCVVSRPCQPSCYRPRTSTFCSPCKTTYARSVRSVSSSCCSHGYGSRCCGSSGFRHLNYRVGGFSSLGYGSGLCRPSYLASRPCQPSCYRPRTSTFCSPCKTTYARSVKSVVCSVPLLIYRLGYLCVFWGVFSILNSLYTLEISALSDA
uniref:Keratin-associated protein n=1 Tax=Spermophilus dauricus TaxID=99837 RepID=A0A8C9PYM1_SPEDA